MTRTVYEAINIVLGIIEYAILGRVILSWFAFAMNNPIIRTLYQLVYQLTEPILAPIRNMIGKSSLGKNYMFDFSPIIAYLIIGLIRNFI